MRSERQPQVEIDRDVITAFAATFIPRFDRYPVQLPNGEYATVKRPLTIELVASHVKGDISIGAYALDENSQAKWICFDADDEVEWERLLDLAHDLSKERVAHYLELSRRGGHLWLFTHLLPGRDARRFAKALVQRTEIEDIEIYPKQDVLGSGPGSLVRLPLGIHQRTGRRYHFITLEGDPLAPTIREQVRLLARPDRTSPYFIADVLKLAPEIEPVSPTPTFTPLNKAEAKNLSDRLKAHISVYHFVAQYVELDKSGRGFCPFHDDQHKSFGVNVKGNYWNCFAGCGGGSVIHFWQKWRQVNGQDPAFIPTITDLADMLL